MSRQARVIRTLDNALDVTVEYGGIHYAVKDVGIGHPPHTISDGRGRVATGAEVALAKALVEHAVSEVRRQVVEEVTGERGKEIAAGVIRGFFGGDWQRFQGGDGVASLILEALAREFLPEEGERRGE